MSATLWLALLAIALGGGACIAVRTPVNSGMAAVTTATGGTPSWAGLSAAPWRARAGRALGALHIWAAVGSVASLSVVTMAPLLIHGQWMAALVFDGTAAFGLNLGLAVLFVGAGLVLSRL